MYNFYCPIKKYKSLVSSIYILLMLQVKIKIDIVNNFRVLYF